MNGCRKTLAEPLRILRPFWPLALFATLAGGLSGIASATLIGTVNRALHSEGEEIFGLLVMFGALFIVAVVGELVGNIGNSAVGQRIIAALRKDLSGRILSAPLAQIEHYKSHRLIAALDKDVGTIGVFTFNFSTVAIAFAITVGCFGYLAGLSPAMCALALAVAAADGVLQVWAGHVAIGRFDAARSAHDDLQKHYLAIIDGAKELRLNRDRRMKFRSSQLDPAIDRIRDQFLGAVRIFFAAKSFNSAAYLLLLLAILMLGRHSAVNSSTLSGFVLVLLFIRGPIEQLISVLPLFSEAQVSLRRIAELSAAFARSDASPDAGRKQTRNLTGRTIELRNVCYEFPAPEGGAPFVVGPLNLTIEHGETLFIAGGNGTGKTTLIKLLLGLYNPSGGEIWCDGERVTATRVDDYRQLFSAIFFDYFLFEDIVAHGSATQAEIDRYLRMLGLADKVTVRNGVFSTTDLSTGQRKRLALIHAFLERRPIVVLDEWAADQDPVFRRVFYRQLLPALKRQGKTVIVVSHDDRFFDQADRLVRMEAGHIIEEKRPSRLVLCAAAGLPSREASVARNEAA